MVRKTIQISDDTHDALRQEALFQSLKKKKVVTMGDVVAGLAKRLVKKYRRGK